MSGQEIERTKQQVEQVTHSDEDTRKALAERFMSNTDEENDELVERVNAWQRKNGKLWK